jgi:hypothetical protein
MPQNDPSFHPPQPHRGSAEDERSVELWRTGNSGPWKAESWRKATNQLNRFLKAVRLIWLKRTKAGSRIKNKRPMLEIVSSYLPQGISGQFIDKLFEWQDIDAVFGPD